FFESDRESFGTFSNLDSETLKRIISNLVSNAVEAMKFSGEVHVALLNKHDFFKISVSDTGPELSIEQKKRVFEKGFTTKEKGNGLGLYYARKDIEASNGHIQFIREDKTIVEITLPRVDIPKTFASKMDILGANKVIILDDDESIHQIWK